MVQFVANGITFDLSENKTLLETVIENGYNVNHSCRDGRCNECRVDIINHGKSVKQLACQYYAQPGDEIFFNTFENYKLPDQIISPAKINTHSAVSENYTLIELRLPPQKKLNFFAGQYINVNIPKVGIRSYSIYSQDITKNTFSILVGKVKDGLASEFFFENAQKDALLTIHGPFGSFFYRPNEARKVIFCATGSGIAPINAIFETLEFHADLSKGTEVHLLWSNKYSNDFFKLSSIIPPSVRIKRFVTREVAKCFNSGRIVTPTIELLKSVADDENISLYTAGHPDFIAELHQEIKKLEKVNLNVYSDSFIKNRKN